MLNSIGGDVKWANITILYLFVTLAYRLIDRLLDLPGPEGPTFLALGGLTK